METRESFIREIYLAEHDNLFKYAVTVFPNPHIAEELVQDTFCTAIEKYESLISHPNPKGWLITVLKHKIGHAKRDRAQYLKHFIQTEVELSGDYLSIIESKLELQSVLCRMNEVLTPEDYYIFKRFFLEEASHLQIAKELGISVWASQKRIERIRKVAKHQFPEKNCKKTPKSSQLFLAGGIFE